MAKALQILPPPIAIPSILYPSLPSLSLYPSLAKLHFHLGDPHPSFDPCHKGLPFEIKPGEAGVTQTTFTPQSKAELRAIAKEFLKVTEDPHKIVEEFNIIIQT